MAVIGPSFRKKAASFMTAVRGLPPDRLENPPGTIVVDGEELLVPSGAFSPQFSYLVGGEKVDMVRIGYVIVTVQRTPGSPC
jgi:valyl-tRNA synthetase